jgi:hypothetical protein
LIDVFLSVFSNNDLGPLEDMTTEEIAKERFVNHTTK